CRLGAKAEKAYRLGDYFYGDFFGSAFIPCEAAPVKQRQNVLPLTVIHFRRAGGRRQWNNRAYKFC
ncbi:MAG: hypothetical protein ACRCYJ_03245, partial [Plesiomonas shigelloides]